MAKKPVTRRDSLDFRDRIYQPMLSPLKPEWLPLERHICLRDQGYEGACAGFGLAAVIDYVNRSNGIKEPVSARMLYEMAKHHDQWPGEDYEGSTARGAMKGWHKNGVCPEKEWEYRTDERGFLDAGRQQAALKYPLGAYYRILPKRSDLHAALHETGAIYATAATHAGWSEKRVKDNGGVIPYKRSWKQRGGHAFAILGYTDRGFIIQNSWGKAWGGIKVKRTRYEGCALWSYEDFEENLWDAWVAQLALPVSAASALDRRRYQESGGRSQPRAAAPSQHKIRDHYIHIDDGQFDPFGDYPSRAVQVKEIIERALGGQARHLLLYAHGGLNDVKHSAARVAAWRPVFRDNRIHELHFVWETGLWAELRDVLLGKQDFAQQRAGGPSDWWDRVVERASHALGHALWKEMRSDARVAFDQNQAGTETLRMLFDAINKLRPNQRPTLHLVGHSAGSIWFARLLDAWTQLAGPPIENLVLFAPACTTALFNGHIYPALKTRLVVNLHHFHLDDDSERGDNVAEVYRKSLLYLVSRSFQKRGEVVPLMGMEKYIDRLNMEGITNRVRHYNTRDHRDLTRSDSHGGFDNDLFTMNTMLQIVLGQASNKPFKEEHLQGY
jgi:hypothetical protein